MVGCTLGVVLEILRRGGRGRARESAAVMSGPSSEPMSKLSSRDLTLSTPIDIDSSRTWV
jgi:hypothetical protein